MTTFLSLEPFVPSGSNYAASKELFRELGFTETWDAGNCVGFEKDGCKFILQQYDDRQFAENFMVLIRVKDIMEFWEDLTRRALSTKLGIRIGNPTDQPYGKEVNIIDIAGVCWHFVE